MFEKCINKQIQRAWFKFSQIYRNTRSSTTISCKNPRFAVIFTIKCQNFLQFDTGEDDKREPLPDSRPVKTKNEEKTA